MSGLKTVRVQLRTRKDERVHEAEHLDIPQAAYAHDFVYTVGDGTMKYRGREVINFHWKCTLCDRLVLDEIGFGCACSRVTVLERR